ncbi:hypothetical protein BT63DRAFT_453049 [Microthyrium microscopicum]|uniref:Fucose-specific lectin n=1 Tax=Microthyrium microscopicum TaxID=703497 RepID=A0A6A6UJT6_9PEZI|nr:hypothetical protein BT63DRAFT_453049 [Microthyrium microscopicum]
MIEEAKNLKPDIDNHPEVAYSDLPEVCHDLPEVVPSDDSGLEVAHPRVAIITIAGVMGGAIGGTRKGHLRHGTNHSSPGLSDGVENNSAIQKGYVYPTAVSWGPGRLDVVGVYDQGLLWHKALVNETWLGWDIISRNIHPQSNVAVISRNPNTLDMLAVGADNAAYWDWVRGNTTTFSVEKQFGIHNSSIESVSLTADRMDSFSLNQAGKLQQRRWSETSNWDADWHVVGNDDGSAEFLFTPTAIQVSVESGGIFLVEAMKLEVYQSTWSTNGSFSVMFRNIGGSCTSRPSILSWAGETIIFCRGKDTKLWSVMSSGADWKPWEQVASSPTMRAEPHAVVFTDDQGAEHLFVFVQTENSYALGRYVLHQSTSSIGSPEWRDMAGTFTGPPRAVVMNLPSPRVYVLGYNGFRNLVVRHIDIINGTFYPSVWQDLGNAVT